MREDFLPLARPHMDEPEMEAVREVLKTGFLTTGPKVTEFEEAVSEYLGGGLYSVALNSCTGGLYLALLAHGVGKGDEVIVPTWTFAATGHVVAWTGAKPVLCDVDSESLNIDISKMQSLVTPRTKAVMPVHFAGYPAAMDEIIALSKERNFAVIEDAAHAMGTEYKGQKVGRLGDATVFSFYATKNLTCGEGGMVVSEDREVIEKIRKSSYFGINKKAYERYSKTGSWYYEIEGMGYKYNMDSIHAAIGLTQLGKLDDMNKRRRRIAKLYKENLDGRIRFTKDAKENYHTYHLFPILVDKNIMDRNGLIASLKEKNIGTSVHFIPLHKHPYYAGSLQGRSFPVADAAYEEVISIPMFPHMSCEDAYYVIENINNILKKGG